MKGCQKCIGNFSAIKQNLLMNLNINNEKCERSRWKHDEKKLIQFSSSISFHCCQKSPNIFTALTVRFLTKRYIGEYDHQADKVHKHEILVDTEAVLVEIWDTCMVSQYFIKSCKNFTSTWHLRPASVHCSNNEILCLMKKPFVKHFQR